MLQYKVGDKAEVIESRSTPYVKGDTVTIKELCDNGTEDEHYYIDGNKGKWWLQECYLKPLAMQNNLRPFDLAAALDGKPVVTRDGRKVTNLHKIDAEIEQPVIGLIEGDDSIDTWCLDGRYSPRDSRPISNDLFMAPGTVTKWVNVYHNEFGGPYFFITGQRVLFDTQEQAELNKTSSEYYIATVPIIFTV